MLVELAVSDLGVIERLHLRLESGMTVLTGETGAGKTMIVEAIALLMGGKADPARVRPGADHAVVEGLFVVDDVETVLRRVVPASGRSTSHVDRSISTAKSLTEIGAGLVEICGQHSHQSLLSPTAQRQALDRYASIDLGPLSDAVSHRRAIEADIASLGGDERTRTREIDLLQYQLSELDDAGLGEESEDERLSEAEDLLGDAVACREAGEAASLLLGTEEGAAGLLSNALSAIADRAAFVEEHARLHTLYAEVSDLSASLRRRTESIEEDPERLTDIRARRQLLVDLRRKYGETLADVLAYRGEVAERLNTLRSHDRRVSELERELEAAIADEQSAAARVAEQRRAAAPRLAQAIEERLGTVSMPDARVDIVVDDLDPGDRVEFRLAAHNGMPPRPVADVASGGELSRTMLALHLELSAGAPTMVFDEVDAGLGGGAAVSVGKSLADLASDRQVLVVTHLPQVAAYADHQLSVEKATGAVAVSTISLLDDDRRVVELSRMLSGHPDSDTGRRHASELLETAAADRAH